MQLDERLRQVADQVPSPPEGDASATFQRGVRRRRRQRVMRGTLAVVLVGVLGVGVASLLDRPARLDIANEPVTPAPPEATDGPAITQVPTLTVSSREPFSWVVAVSAGDGDRWCVTARQGTTEVTDQVGQPCDQPLPLDPNLDWHESTATGPGGQQLVWGSAPADTDEVVVEFTDGTRREAQLASSDTMDVTLWAIGHQRGDVHAVEAQGENWARGSVALDDGWGVGEMLLVVAGIVVIAILLAAVRRRSRRKNTGPSVQTVEDRADDARPQARVGERWTTRLGRAPWRWLTSALETVTRPRSRRQRWLVGSVVSLVLAAGFVAASIGYTFINAWSDCIRLAPESALVAEPSPQWQGMVCTFTDEGGRVIDTRTLPWIGKAPGT